MSKHTPGPWKAVDNSWEISTVYAADGTVVAECPIAGCVTEESQDDLEPIMEANARLVAASPDLLAACKEFIAWDCDEHPEMDPQRGERLRRQMHAAIAKAEPEA